MVATNTKNHKELNVEFNYWGTEGMEMHGEINFSALRVSLCALRDPYAQANKLYVFPYNHQPQTLITTNYDQ